MTFKRILNSRLTAVGAGAAVLALLAGGAGFAAGQINSGDIQNNSVRSVDLKDGDIRPKDLHKSVLKGTATDADVNKLANAIVAQNDTIEDLTDRVEELEGQGGGAGTLADSFTSASPTTIDIGGSFTGRAAELGTIDLEPGKYIVNGFGFFDSVSGVTHGDSAR